MNLPELHCIRLVRMHESAPTYILTPWCKVLLGKLTGLQLVKKFPEFHGTRRFITTLKSVRHLSLSWASPIQSIYPHPTSWRSVLILSTHLCLGLHSGPLPSGFPTNTLYNPLSSPIRATWPAHLILLHFITRTILGEEYKSFSSSLCNLLHSPVTSSFLGPNILLNTMFSNTLSFLSSRRVSDQVSHPYKTIGKIIVLYTLIYKFWFLKTTCAKTCIGHVTVPVRVRGFLPADVFGTGQFHWHLVPLTATTHILRFLACVSSPTSSRAGFNLCNSVCFSKQSILEEQCVQNILPSLVAKDKAIPLQARTDPVGSRRMRLPDFKTIGTWRW